jgi:hypothetical protein
VALANWTTGLLSQNGNSVFTWNVFGSLQTSRDVVVVGPESGSSGVRINSHQSLTSTNHLVTVEVIGSSAVAYRIRGTEV